MEYVGWEALDRTQNVSIWWKIEIIINLSYLKKLEQILPLNHFCKEAKMDFEILEKLETTLISIKAWNLITTFVDILSFCTPKIIFLDNHLKFAPSLNTHTHPPLEYTQLNSNGLCEIWI